MSIIYKSKRIGLKGKEFTLYKFRTMVKGADKLGGSSTSADDPRLTKIGKWLRKYNLDELPQIINIIKREMNPVGPRPEVKEYVDMMTEHERNVILSVRPGLSDLATLENMDEGSRLAGSDDPDKTYLEDIRPEKLKLQMAYVETRCFWLDVKIILKTIWRIFVRK